MWNMPIFSDRMALMNAWDVIVVGGGPAGMMAAGTAAEKGARVVLIEKNDTLGKKLLLTGGGRCNFTNVEFDTRKFLEKFRDNAKFLFSTFSQWSVRETLDFFNKRGMETKVENELRAFPVSDRADTVLNVLLDYMKENEVTILSDSPVSKIVNQGDVLIGVELKSGEVIKGKSIIIATGGTSRPETGSTGDGYLWLKDIGHTIIPPSPSLVPLAMKNAWVKRLAGVTLNDIKIAVIQNDKKQSIQKGKILFTHVGVSGPTILNMSKGIGDLLKNGGVTIALDLLPQEDYASLNAKLQALFTKYDKKMFRNVLPDLIPSAMVPAVMMLAGIDQDVLCNGVSREERIKLINLLKALPMQVDKLLGAEMAIVASGGVNPKEVDFKTMRSRLFPNLYLAGDIIDIDRPSGGFSLQLCWTTGRVAGISAWP